MNFLGVVLVPPGELKGLFIGRLWWMAVTVGTLVVAYPGVCLAFCPLVPIVVLWLGVLWVF